MSPYHFVFRESDKMLLFWKVPLQPTDITVEEFDELLEGFMKTVDRDTYPLWSGKANKTAAAQRAVDEKVNDVPKPTPVVPQVQPAARGLAKTIWSWHRRPGRQSMATWPSGSHRKTRWS